MDNKQYSQYYVAFLDILGFKNRVNDPKNSCEDILKIFRYLSQYNDMFFMCPANEIQEIKHRIKMKVMSDSICIYTKANVPSALHDLVSFCAIFQYNLLLVEPSVFIRGGIVFGDMYVDDDTMFGPALIEAYLLQEKNAKTPRIIMCKNTFDRGMAEMDERFKKPLSNWVFRDNDAFYTLDYFSLLTGNVLQRVNKTISKELDTTTDESIRQKYLYIEKQIRQHSKENTDA